MYSGSYFKTWFVAVTYILHSFQLPCFSSIISKETISCDINRDLYFKEQCMLVCRSAHLLFHEVFQCSMLVVLYIFSLKFFFQTYTTYSILRCQTKFTSITGCWNFTWNQVEFRSMLLPYVSNSSHSKLQQVLTLTLNTFERLESGALGE